VISLLYKEQIFFNIIEIYLPRRRSLFLAYICSAKIIKLKENIMKLLKKSSMTALLGLFALSLAVSAPVKAETNPFETKSIVTIVVEEANGKCGEGKADAKGKCGEGKAAKKGKCGEGKCGESKKAKKGKCGEGKCGEGKKAKKGKCGEGKCGEGKKAKKGKCGEGKCGENKAKAKKCGG
jgi:uncharacterized low-complexity protein